MKTFRKGGVHPPQLKLTAKAPIVRLELPREATLAVAQHIGAPGRILVKKGDSVTRGQMIAEPGGNVSAAVHSPITGTVAKIDKIKSPYGLPVDVVTIVADEEQHAADEAAALQSQDLRTPQEIAALTPEEIKHIVEQAGIVGLGGATFPTKVKLSPPPGMKADILIVNGAECEPYLTCDHALMLAEPEAIVEGTALVMKAAGVDRAVIAVEANKPDAIKALAEAAASHPGIEVQPLKVKYPQGGEKQLIEALTRREVQSGKLPVSVGAIVQNVATIFAIDEAVRCGKPLLDRVVTVTGHDVKHPGNYRCAIGTPLAALTEAAGGVPDSTRKILLGGPMMGRAVVGLDSPSVKGISGIVMLPEAEARRREPEPCIRCGRCIEACPMGLEPLTLSKLAARGLTEDAKEAGLLDCIECGSCQYTCPAARPLLDRIRVGKANARRGL